MVIGLPVTAQLSVRRRWPRISGGAKSYIHSRGETNRLRFEKVVYGSEHSSE